jgi:hypothetical protein
LYYSVCPVTSICVDWTNIYQVIWINILPITHNIPYCYAVSYYQQNKLYLWIPSLNCLFFSFVWRKKWPYWKTKVDLGASARENFPLKHNICSFWAMPSNRRNNIFVNLIIIVVNKIFSYFSPKSKMETLTKTSPHFCVFFHSCKLKAQLHLP